MILCIAGMHRSGTSLAASWLEKCGLTICDGSLLGPGPGNPKGHFEDTDFLLLQGKSILREIPVSNGWKFFEGKPLKFKGALLMEARKLVDERNKKHSLWGWKDPRTVVFLEQWKEIIPDLKVVSVWRPFAEVAASLMERSRKCAQIKMLKIGLLESAKLYGSYNRILCEFAEKYPEDTLLLPLEYVIQHDKETIKLIAAKLKIHLNYQPIKGVYDDSLLQGYSFFSKRLISCITPFLFKISKIEDKLKLLSDTP